MRILAAARSDVGKRRKDNEDRFQIVEGSGFYGVCDGMGGHAAGEIAASVALEAAERTVRHRPWVGQKFLNEGGSIEPVMNLLDRAVRVANAEVFDLSLENRAYHQMGCTMTLLLHLGNSAVLASVGDSRFYLVRGQDVRQLTLDHTIGAEFQRSGLPVPDAMAGSRYTRLLSRSIGTTETVRADVFPLELVVGDRFVICTDGLSDYLGDGRPLVEATQADSPDEVAARLVNFANESGGADNVTVVVGFVEND
jgi:protein phosphatase